MIIIISIVFFINRSFKKMDDINIRRKIIIPDRRDVNTFSKYSNLELAGRYSKDNFEIFSKILLKTDNKEKIDKLLMEMTLLNSDLINIDAIKLIIKHGANPNYFYNYDSTPLSCALAYPMASSDIIELLIESGADVNIQFRNYKTILMCFIVNSSQSNDLEIMKFIIRKSHQINCKNLDGNSALMLCFHNYNIFIRCDIIKILLENKADVYLKNNKGDNIFDIIKDKIGINSDIYSLIFNYKNIKNDNFCECDINFIYKYL